MSKVLVRSTKARATYVGEVEVIFDENGLAWVEKDVADELFKRSNGGYSDAKKNIGSDLSDLNSLELLNIAYQQILQDPDKSMLLRLRGSIRQMVAEVESAVDVHQRQVGASSIPGMEQQMGQRPMSVPGQMSPMIEEPVNPDDVGIPSGDEEPLVEPSFDLTKKSKKIIGKHKKSKKQLRRLRKDSMVD